MQGVGNVTCIIGGDALYGASDNIERLGQIYADVAENVGQPAILILMLLIHGFL